MRSTTRATSRRSASSTRRATWRWCAARSGASRSCSSSATPSIETPRQRRAGPLPAHRAWHRATRRAGLPAIEAIDMREPPPERGQWLSPPLVEAVRRDLGARRAGAAVPEPARLCADHPLPQLRLRVRMPELLGVAGRAPIPPPARMPPLRHLHSHPRDLPELRGRAFARAVRARRRAHRRGGGGALSRRAPRAARRQRS